MSFDEPPCSVCGSIGCGGDDAAVVEPPTEAAPQQEITIEREVVDGTRMLIAYDGARQQLSTFQTDVTEAGIETNLTVGVDASRTVMRTTIAVTKTGSEAPTR
jgi:hypothetical protein